MTPSLSLHSECGGMGVRACVCVVCSIAPSVFVYGSQPDDWYGIIFRFERH